MNEKEKLLFKQLCRLGDPLLDEMLLKEASPEVLGYLFYNRMQGIAYHRLHAKGLLQKVPREFRNSLKAAYDCHRKANDDYDWCVKNVTSVLSVCECPYAMLKGAFLCFYYPDGCRISNDIDLLVSPRDVTKIGRCLTNAGFQQGNIVNGVFVPATRKEIIESKMMRGETVPYIKEVDLPTMKYLEVDINFSLDYQHGDWQLIEDMLSRTKQVPVNDRTISVLDEKDFFIHLCVHLYKEATTYPWIVMNRDMTLYKYADIYYLLSRMPYGDVAAVFERAQALGLEKVCAFALLQTDALLGVEPYIMVLAVMVLGNDKDFLHRVISPTEKKQYVYKNKNIFERFFAHGRSSLLKEVENDEAINDDTPST